MLQVKNLCFTHRKDLKEILNGFSCVLNDGDKAVIIGEEGNGKSTLLKWIYDPLLVEGYVEASGERIINNERLGYLPQELSERDKAKSVYEFFMEEPLFPDLSPKESGKYARNFHVPADFFYREQKMETLSGGEKVKAQMLRLLIGKPSVLLLDEPSNDIDIETLEWLEKLINEWQHIVLYISHDETLIENTANRVIHLEQIRRKTISRYTVANMPYLQYKEERFSKFEKQKQQALSDRREKKLRDEKYMRILQSVNHAQATIGGAGKNDLADKMQAARNLKDKMHTVKSMGKRFEREDENMAEMPEQESAIFFKLGDKNSAVPAGKTVIEYTLEKLYTPDGERCLSSQIELQIRGAEKIGIVGLNGAGKTTLLREIAEELLARNDIHAEYMPQNYEELLNMDITPIEFLDSSGDRKKQTKIRTFLGALKYTADEMARPIAELSGGQKAKILLLKMSLSGANVLILDEPTRNFSPLSGPVIRQMLAEFPGSVISISHDRKYIEEVCTKVYRLTEDGLVLES